jgi:manganese/zinc/iron transport system substrate-binding protein
VLLCLAVLVLSGCGRGGQSSAATPGPIRTIVCTTEMVADLVRGVAGPDVSVIALMGPGVDPHLFSPSPQDAERLAQADVIVFTGLNLEAGLGNYLEKLSQKNRRVYALASGITSRERLLQVAAGQFDPHIWNDLDLWGECALGLATQLATWQPELAEQYQERGAAYHQQLQELLQQSRAQIAQIPPERRLLVTAHDAFAYLGRSLGLEVAAVQGISTNTEVSVRRVEQIVDLVRQRQVPTIFAEASVNEKPVQAIREGCHRQGHTVKLGGTLYSDTLGPSGSPAATFAGMFATNVQTIVEGLQSPR